MCRATRAEAPLRDGADALRVTWLEVEISRPGGRVTCRNGFVTDLDVTHDNVAEIAACGRARWKIENETFNVPETNGYNLEHNFGHGRDGLANLLVVLNLLAFAAHTACDLGDAAWQRARRTLGARKRLFEHVRTITAHVVFPSWTGLIATLPGWTRKTIVRTIPKHTVVVQLDAFKYRNPMIYINFPKGGK